MSTDRYSHGWLKMLAWMTLVLLAGLVCAREPALRFLDDFLPRPVSPHLAPQIEPPRLSVFEPLDEHRRSESGQDEILIRPATEADRTSLLRHKFTAKATPQEVASPPAAAPARSESLYANRYDAPPADVYPFFSPLDRDPVDRRGTVLSDEEIPSLFFPNDNIPSDEESAATATGGISETESATVSSIKDRSRLDAMAPMVALPGGVFSMGSDQDAEADQRPRHRVRLSPFKLDCYEVTNRQFQYFVRETGYRTTAERIGWSYVFDLDRNVWVRMVGACWWNPTGKHPGAGPESGTVTAMHDLPVCHVSWDDAAAFCRWSGKRLPSEAEWEYAAKGGRIETWYPWGDRRSPNGVEQANYWQGWFPRENTLKDGHLLSANVGSYAANSYGIFDLGGNVWEWCADRYCSDYYRRSPWDNPLGPAPEEAETTLVSTLRVHRENGRYIETEFDGVTEVPLRVIRGGSFLSAENSDAGYRVTARGNQPQPLSFQDVGFRCAE